MNALLPVCEDLDAERRLNEFVDGELAPAEQPELFGHLAACADCRAQFDALLAFRRAVRDEPLVLPPAANTAVLARLDRLRRTSARARARRAERSPLAGTLHRRVSLGAALMVTLAVAAMGLAIGRPQPPAPEPARQGPRVVQAVDAGGALFLLDRPLFVVARREPAAAGVPTP
jgi:anti-sigma factor RsiW